MRAAFRYASQCRKGGSSLGHTLCSSVASPLSTLRSLYSSTLIFDHRTPSESLRGAYGGDGPKTSQLAASGIPGGPSSRARSIATRTWDAKKQAGQPPQQQEQQQHDSRPWVIGPAANAAAGRTRVDLRPPGA